MRATETLPDHMILETWAQIASYLNVSERTARRYADEGMPVNRDSGCVWASKPHLDDWMQRMKGEQAYIWKREVVTLLRKTRQALDMDHPIAQDFARKIDHVLENAPERI